MKAVKARSCLKLAYARLSRQLGFYLRGHANAFQFVVIEIGLNEKQTIFNPYLMKYILLVENRRLFSGGKKNELL